MATQIYNLPEGFEAPKWDLGTHYKEIKKKDDEFIEKLRQWLKDNGYNDPNAGEIITFPVADGKAAYMVIQTGRTNKLMHLPLGDSWSYQYIERLNKKDILEEIRREKAIKEMFSKKETD